MKRIFLLVQLVCLLLFATPSWAASLVTYYVNSSCPNNGNGTTSSCAASGGAAGATNNIASAITIAVTAHANLVSDDVRILFSCAGSAADTSVPDFTGFTTDATRYLEMTVEAGSRHSGTWATNKYRIENSGYDAALRIREPHVRVSYLQIEQKMTSAGGGTPAAGIELNFSDNNGHVSIDNTIVKYTGDYTNQGARGITLVPYFGNNTNVIIRNSLIYDFTYNLFLTTNTNDDIYVYNNTVMDAVTGNFEYRLYGTGATFTMKNNIVQGSATNYNSDGSSGATFTHNNNLSEDASSPDAAYQSSVVVFEDESGNNFHLATGDTEAKDSAANLSAVTEGFTIDVDGETRTGTWDIGFDEYTAPTSSAVVNLISTGEL